MLTLKQYQEDCLDKLAEYLRGVAHEERSDTPFASITRRDYLSSTLPEKLRGVPYICLRVPTGGGKTLIAAHAVSVITKELIRLERSVVLWLAPSRTIVQQTIKALQDPHHPYRQALDEKLEGRVEVLSLADALHVTRATLDGATTIVVSTIQALRVEETDGRKVYEQNGALQHHFTGLTAEQEARLERHEGDGPVESLANVLRLRRPIIIVDEAHNARTGLSFETLDRLRPSCIVEFTATPDQKDNPSNVLHHVSALQLKAEHMVKLPIKLVNRPQWREAVQAALGQQRSLEEAAQEEEKATGEYIRPIVLFQAEANRGDDSVTVDVLKKALAEEFDVPKEQIAVSTGNTAELDDDLLTRDSDVRYIITVQKLREGWDCPFAYILCSVANLSSTTAVEQILGRVLRLPKAKLKNDEALNRAYAFATSQRFHAAAKALTDALVESGFERFEAQTLIERGATLSDDVTGGLFNQSDDEETVVETFSAPPNTDAIPEEVRPHLRVEASLTEGEPVKVTYTGPPLSRETTVALQKAFTADEDREAADRLGRRTRGESTSPVALGKPFTVPRLAIRVDGLLEIFEDQFRDAPWKLSDQNCSLSETEFAVNTRTSRVGEIDIDDDRGRFSIRELHEHLTLIDAGGPQSETELAVWLDRQIPHPDVLIADSTLFFRKLVQSLTEERGIPLDALVASRFRLRDAAENKVDAHRRKVFDDAFQQVIGGTSDAGVEVDPSIAFSFLLKDYPAHRLYDGHIEFKKHYYTMPGDMNGEEAECATLLDGLEETLYWVRNIERHPRCSFYLPTSSDNFYPDFLAVLRDGRVLCVEYKGAHLLTSEDTQEKRMVGELWEARSGGSCLFRLVGKDDMEASIRSAVRS